MPLRRVGLVAGQLSRSTRHCRPLHVVAPGHTVLAVHASKHTRPVPIDGACNEPHVPLAHSASSKHASPPRRVKLVGVMQRFTSADWGFVGSSSNAQTAVPPSGRQSSSLAHVAPAHSLGVTSRSSAVPATPSFPRLTRWVVG